MNSITVYLLILLTFQFDLFADEAPKTHMLILGGSGELLGDQTIFDKSLTHLGYYYRDKMKRGEIGQTSIAFDGGHNDTDLIKNKFTKANSVQNFTKETYQQEIDHFKSMMSDNAVIKKGEQLLVYINSHGQEKSDGTKTHLIAIGEKDIIGLDRLAELQTVATKNGIKLAIIDLSCFSGNTQALADENTCIISGSGENHYSYAGDGFSGRFADKLMEAKNLESAFLKARNSNSAADFPIISTSEGKLIKDKIYHLMTPYLRFNDRNDTLTKEVIHAASNAVYSCEKNNSFEKLNASLDEIEKMSTSTKKLFMFSKEKQKPVEFNELKKLLQEYKTIQDHLTEVLRTMHVEKLSQIEEIDTTYKYSWAALLATDWDKFTISIQNYLNTHTPLSPEDRKKYEYNKSIYQKASLAKQKILKENPGLDEYKNVVTKYDDGQKKTLILAEKIAILEKRLFDGLYKKYAKENNQTNPCREFKL